MLEYLLSLFGFERVEGVVCLPDTGVGAVCCCSVCFSRFLFPLVG